MFVRNAVVALSVDPKSCEPFYLIKIIEEENKKSEDVEDGFGQAIKKG